MRTQSKLIILRGNSGSGKSTVAKELQQKLGRGTLLISQDLVRREMLWVKDGMGTKAMSLLSTLISYGGEHCDYVILEGILNSKWYHNLFEEIKNEFAMIYAYYYELSFEETLLRHQTKPNKNDFGEVEMKQWWNEKDLIITIPEKIITKDFSLEETVQMIYSDVTCT